MRCPDCAKFVSYDEPEVEVDSEEITSSETYYAQVVVKLNCAECSTELAEATLDGEVELSHVCPLLDDEHEPEFEILNSEVSPIDRYNTIDQHGKPIKLARFQKHYYGAEIEAEIQCVHCEEKELVTLTVEEAASAFESVV